MSPASLVGDLDPGVERVIMRCLEKDPQDRPTSARAVAASLPGGNPLAAALEAGEIPSPEMVAQARRGGGLRPPLAWAGFAAFCGGLALLTWLGGRTLLVRMVPLEKSPQVLVERARQIAFDLGQTRAPVDELYEFAPNNAYLAHIDRTAPTGRGRWSELRGAQPAGLRFWYRRSPRHLERLSPASIGSWMDDPAPTQPGMVEIALDTQGRLLSYRVVPADSGATDTLATTPDWNALFAAAGFDRKSFSSVQPEWTPPSYADTRAAWAGHYPEAREIPIRLEAAALAGRVVAFRVIEPWTRPAAAPEPSRSFWDRAADLVGGIWFVVVVLGAGLVALRNVRLGRGDRKGAVRLGLYLGGVRMLWMLGDHHAATRHELAVFMSNMAWAAYRICLVWVFYLAFEPYARRLWPQMMVSWVRLLKGRVRDPLVGRDLLVGLLFGVAFALTIRLSILLPQFFGGKTGQPEGSIWTFESLRGTRHVLSSIAGAHTQAVLFCFTGILFLLVLRIVVRKTWLAVGLMGVLSAVMFNPSTGSPVAYVASILITFALFFFVLFRAGFLPIMLGFTVNDLVRAMPLTFDLSVWYAAASLLPMLLLVGVAVYAMRSSLAGQPLFRDAIFDVQETAKP